MQTQTSNTLHNAIMEVGSKDRPPMLAPGNYVQWKSKIKRYIDTKPNHELIHYCLKNPPYELGWKDKEFPTSEGSLSQELKTVSYHKLYDILKQHQHEVNEIGPKKIAHVANPLALVAQQQPVYHPQTHPTHYTQNSSTRSQQTATRNKGKAIARETVGSTVVRKSRIQCYNCKEFRHVARECQKLKRAKDAAYHKEKMLLCKQEEVRIQLKVEQADWKDDTDDDKLEDQELEAHYIEEINQNDDDNDLAKKHISNNREEADQDDQILQKECKLLASLIEQLKVEIDGSKQTNKSLESSNKALKKANMFLQNEVTNLQCDYLELLEKCEGLETELSKSKMMSKGVILTTSVSRPSLKSNPQGDRVMYNNSQGKTQEVEDH
nr:hypothetical protein [Tanacetum cinerariifolium]